MRLNPNYFDPQPESEGVEGWEKQWPDHGMCDNCCTDDIFKDFIRNLLQAQAKQIRQEEAEKYNKIMEELKKKLRAPQSRGAKKTNEILRKKNPNHWKELAKKRWKRK